MDVTVKRNAFGRQRESFEVMLDVKGVGNDFPAVFIRAPYIEEVGPEVQVLAEVDGKIVAAQQGTLLGAAFHPELTDDLRFHAHFVEMVKEAKLAKQGA
jgi:5'-phosphate synthase pdxT subunit